MAILLASEEVASPVISASSLAVQLKVISPVRGKVLK